nr:hypothetical protein [Tanacetum cinerariifolium]
MATSVIPISSDSSDESVGSQLSRMILFGVIPTIIPIILEIPTETFVIPPVAPIVETTIIATPTGLRDLISYSDSDSLVDMFSPKYISPLPTTSSFVCIDSTKTSDNLSDRLPSKHPYEVAIARWRRKVASRPSPSAELPIAPILTPPRFHESPAHTSGHSTSDQSFSGISSPATIIDDSPAPSRFIYPPPIITPLDSEAYRHWSSALLFAMYPLTASESSSEDSSSESCAGSSRKRCRSSTIAMVPLLTPAPRALASTCADLLPTRKRFGDSYSFEESIKEDIDADILADIVEIIDLMRQKNNRMKHKD